MNTLEQIKELRIQDIDNERLKRWITEEIYNLADDFGQKLDQEQGRHIATRLLGTFNNSKIKTWHAGTIHSVFQSGLTGAYGKAAKVTYYMLINWIWAYERSQRAENKSTGEFEINYDKPDDYYRRQSKEWVPFIRWCQERNVAAHMYEPDKLIELKKKFTEIGAYEMDKISDSLIKYEPAGTINLK